ncbi:phenylalanine--tRNA ligase subunit beta [Fundicoccus sp. Sow4_F4]|uniref:phenylalanine--tRNA ligase subunit beta n=1 Tax=Fundicoccus sp. Sow4_F4 TaxID=3438783 RepID=UPI003F9067AA
MYLSYEWLNDFLDLKEWSADDIADRMSRTGIEIEGIENIGAQLSNLVIGEVVQMEKMPDSDHLSITQVDIGQGELTQIVCGAPNVHQGAKVIVAVPGAVLPGGFKIKKAKMRGYESNGMLCALQELGFPDNVVPKKYADGIYILPSDAPVGADVVDYLKLDDPILELSITPNRADALSMRGSAHEIGAIIGQAPRFSLTSDYSVIEDQALLDSVSVEVAMPELSPHYQLRLIKDIEIKESPVWLQMRLMKANMRPINNVVDLTNYFMLLYGQPFHAFDFDTLTASNVKVKEADEGSKFTTLDGTERTLTSADILIWGGDVPIALAGVMGGLDSEVSDSTKNVLLEAAVFDPQRVRITSNKFNLRSESSSRFEKGINPATVDEASEQTAAMIATLGQGKVVKGKVEKNTLDVLATEVTLAFEVIERKLGIQMTEDDLSEIMRRLGFSITFNDNYFTVTVPPRRWDILIEADVLEEIARMYGYDRIPTTLPTVPSTPGKLTERQRLIRQTRAISEGFGLNQVISYVLTSPKEAELIKSDSHPFVKLTLPMSEERSVLRQSMFPAMMEIAKYNNAHQNKPLAFYETGKVFYGQVDTALPLEEERYAILISGQAEAASWYAPQRQYDFFTLKGMVEGYFEAIRLDHMVRFEAVSDIDVMHPGRTANIYLGDQKVGFLGQVHPNITNDYDLDTASFYAEIDLSYVVSISREALVQLSISKFPETSRDLALLVSVDQTHDVLVNLITDNAGQYLKKVSLFDLYKGKNIAEDKQSLAYHLVFQNPDATLTDIEVNEAMERVTTALLSIDGLEIR